MRILKSVLLVLVRVVVFSVQLILIVRVVLLGGCRRDRN